MIGLIVANTDDKLSMNGGFAMNFKKTVAKSLIVAMALGLVPVANLQEAKAQGPTITLNSEGVATAANAKFWGIAKEVKDEKKSNFKSGDKFYSISDLQEYVDGVDAYTALKGKAGVLAIGNKAEVSTSEWTLKEIGAGDSTLKVGIVATKSAVFNKVQVKSGLGGDSGVLVATIGKTPAEVNLKTSGDAVEVRLANGNWQTVKAFFGSSNDITDDTVNKKLKMLGQSGSQLLFRLKGQEWFFAGKEVKVKAQGPANAPALKVDTNRDTISLKKGMEYQVKDSGDAEAGKWKTVPATAKTLTFADLGVDKTKDQIVFARTAATTKKLASKVARLTLKKQDKPSDITGDSTATGKAFATSKITFSTNVAYDIKKGATITNESDKDYEFFVAWDGGKVDASKIKWVSLKAPKDPKKPTKASVKFSETDKPGTYGGAEKSKLFVRLAGTKQDKNGIATMASASNAAVLKLKKVDQALTVSEGATATKASITVAATGQAFTTNIKVTVKNLQKKGVAPKIKITGKVNGVTVKSEKFKDDGTAMLTINVSNKAFKDEASLGAKLAFTYSIEGVNENFEYTFSKAKN